MEFLVLNGAIICFAANMLVITILALDSALR